MTLAHLVQGGLTGTGDLSDSGLTVVAAGTAGTGPTNQGTSTALARSDHDHTAFQTLAWFFSGTLAGGNQPEPLTLPEGVSNITITDFRVVADSPGASASTYNIQKCTSGCSGTTPVFGSLYSTNLNLAVNTRTAAKGFALDNSLTFAAGNQLRVTTTVGGTPPSNVSVIMTFKCNIQLNKRRTMRFLTFCTLAALLYVGLLPAPCYAATYTNFDVPGASGALSTGINKWGSVTGYYDGPSVNYDGFVCQASSGTVITFILPGAGATYPLSINASGWTVGYYQDSKVGSLHGFLRNPQYTVLDVPGAGTHDLQGTEALSINDACQISGVYFDSKSVEHGFVRDASGNHTTFDVAGSTAVFSAYLSQSGQVTGDYVDKVTRHGFVRDAFGNITTFDVPGETGTSVTSINTGGEIAGYYNAAGFVNPLEFVRDAAGNVTTFTITGFNGVAGIADNGDVYGAYINSTGTGFGWKRTSAGVISFFKDPSPGPLGIFPTCVSGNGKVAGFYFFKGIAHDFVLH